MLQLRSRRTKPIARLACLATVTQLFALWSPLSASEDLPLHDRIDALIEAAHVGAAAEDASDLEFLRRSHLDLIGRIPTVAETKTFIDDESPHKRKDLVDRLIGGDEFNRFFAIVLDVMLMERRQDNRVTTAEWRKYLQEALADNKPLNQLVQEILAADGTDAKHRSAAKFYLDRNVETHALTRDVSRMFFGRDIQCAQCHDHPLVSDYLQAEYYGLFAFLNRSFLFEDAKDNKKAYLGEKADGHVEFASVFDPDAGKTMAIPQLPDGLALDGEPRFHGDEAYTVKPAKETRPVPKFSRRAQLARLATHTSSEAFARNMANRLWAHMMGQGIVHPVDYHHADNPPSHPKLLSLLARELVTKEYDVRAFLSELALSKTYQRSIEFPPAEVSPASAEAKIALLQQQITGQESVCAQFQRDVTRFRRELSRERRQATTATTAVTEIQKQIDAARKAQQEADKQRADVEKKLAEKKLLAESVAQAASEAGKAAAALPADKDLAAALATLTARSQALEKETETLTATITKHKSDAEQAATTIATAMAEQQQLLSERAALVDLVAEARGAHRAVRSQYLRARDQLDEFKQQLAATECLLDYVTKKSLVPEARAAVDAAAAKLNTLGEELAAATKTEAAELRPQLEQQTRLARQAAETVAAEANALEQRRHLFVALQEAAEKAKQAAELLDGDGQVAQAATALSNRSQEIAEEIDSEAEHHASRRAAADRAHQAVAAIQSRLGELTEERDRIQQAIDRQQSVMAAAHEEFNAAVAAKTAAYETLCDNWTRRFIVKPLKPLSPEQLAASTIHALGLDARFERGAQTEWQSKQKDKKPSEIDEGGKTAEIRALYEKRVRQVESTFVSLFAGAPATPQDVFNSTVDQALFLANDGRVRNWLQPSAGTLAKRLQGISEPQELAAQLYLSVLNRNPEDVEIREIKQYLAGRTDNRNAAIQELVWGLLTSLEFRFNH